MNNQATDNQAADEQATDEQAPSGPAAGRAPAGPWADGAPGPTLEPQFPESPLRRTATDPFRLSATRPAAQPAPAPASARRRAPAVITGAVLAGTLVVVGAATWVAQQPEPAPVAAPTVAPVRLVRSSAPPTVGGAVPLQTEVGTAEAAGTLIVAQHRWTAVRGSGTTPRLMVQVRLSVRSGALSYDPNLVKLFDDHGRLYENTLPLGTSGELGSGRLGPGEATDGWVGFDVPAGATTLVLSSWRGESLAAVRIPS